MREVPPGMEGAPQCRFALGASVMSAATHNPGLHVSACHLKPMGWPSRQEKASRRLPLNQGLFYPVRRQRGI